MQDEDGTKGYIVRWRTYQYSFFSYHFFLIIPKGRISWWPCVKMNCNVKFLLNAQIFLGFQDQQMSFIQHPFNFEN